MFSLISKWCEYIFPERQSHKLVRQTSSETFLTLLTPTSHADFVSLLNFKEPLVRAAVHEAKFNGNPKAFALLATTLEHYLKQQPASSVLIPVPLSKKRLRERGYNQVLEVAKRTMREIDTRTLFRARDTAPQTSLSRADRQINVRGAFEVRPETKLEGRHIIILDDVVTTGATLKATRAALHTLKPASITLLALAH